MELEVVIKGLGQSIQTLDDEIKALEYRKRVYHKTSDTLIKIQMMETAVNQLIIASNRHTYNNVPELLRVAINFTNFFSKLSTTSKIKDLTSKIQLIQSSLSDTLLKDFQGLENNEFMRKEKLNSACLVVDALGDGLRSKIIDQFNKEQLTKFKSLKIDVSKYQDQFSWLRRQFMDLRRDLGDDVPSNWNLYQELAVEFCLYMRQSLENRLKGMDANELHKALSCSVKFEDELSLRFNTTKNYNFKGLISSSFYDFMKVYISWVESIQKDYLDRAMKDEKFDGKTDSSETLFLSIKESLRHTLAIDNADILFDITRIWKKNISAYHEFLKKHIPMIQSAGISSYFKRGSVVMSLSETEISQVCYISKLTSYTQRTLQELENEVKASISEALRTKVAFQKGIKKFQDLYSQCLDILVEDLLNGLDNGLDVISKRNWEPSDKPKYESDYVMLIKKQLEPRFALIKSKMQDQYFKDMGKRIPPKFFNIMVKYVKRIKKMNENGINQLHIDVMGLSDFLAAHANSSDKGEMNVVMKILQTPVEKLLPEYVEHVEKKSIDDFAWFLDCKGVVKSRSYLLEKFKKIAI